MHGIESMAKFMELVGSLYLIVVCIVAVTIILIGAKGFSQSGLPISRKTRIKGRAGKTIGLGCMVTGVLLLLLIAAVLVFGLSEVASALGAKVETDRITEPPAAHD